ncbi:MAG TPA: tRNA (adenosine(37)-N6)-threonylcarbamoyltransferase complex ATPase subunit type 1 TsaE [Terriglobales bacterium]|nr:tRNA (adenosine(37)-N6)-threonylcarbamoyltransferase complex ATPase subunit type 1 TsaE [Terriglobales bacterium]
MNATAEIELATAEATQAYGRRLAAELPPFAVVVLVGELGAGKTTLMQGLAAGWGVAREDEVASPTYTLIHEYHRGGRSLYHLDLYRIETAPQMATLGLEDVWEAPPPGEAKLVALEWGERVEGLLPRPYLRLALRVDAAEHRHLAATWVD